MPKTTNEYYVFGALREVTDQLQQILGKLDDPTRNFSRDHLIDYQETISRCDEKVRLNIQRAPGVDARELLANYTKITEMSANKIKERLRALDREPATSGSHVQPKPSTGAIPKRRVFVVNSRPDGDEIKEAPKSEGTKLLEYLYGEYQADKAKALKKKKKSVKPVLKCGGDLDDIEENWHDVYASDNDEPLPPSLCSTAQPTSGYKPIEFPANDLRTHLRVRQELLTQRQEDDDNHDGRRVIPSRSHDSVSNVSATRTNVHHEGRSNASVSSCMTYQSSQQEKLWGPITGVLYPPRATELPYTISRKDKNLIGMAEIYVQTRNDKKCVICRGKHRVFNCTTFIRASLLERWFLALSKGVCLFCLYPGHSSFTCRTIGTCGLCNIRHNSLLCPKREWNEDPRQ